MKKWIVFLIIAIIAVGGVWYFVNQNKSNPATTPYGTSQTATPPAGQTPPQETAPVNSPPSQTNPTQPKTTTPAGNPPATSNPQSATPPSQAQPTVDQPLVTYTDSGFSPRILHIKVGTKVTFKNQSSGPVWVASNPHPAHTDLPGFDSRQGLSTGQSYQYTFVKIGTWGYHNHLEPSDGGSVVVE